jgi:hypothetical protein
VSGTNCTLSIAQYGYARVRADRAVFGMSVVAYAPNGQSRTGATFYPSKRTSGSFELTLTFAKDSSYRRICEWLERYSVWAANPRTVASPCRVLIPSRNFDMTGVIKDGITYGDEVGAITHSVTLSFVGARDPMELRNNSAISRFRLGKNPANDPAPPYFYPAGTQLKGDVRGWDTVYDTPNGSDDTPDDLFDRFNIKIPGV